MYSLSNAVLGVVNATSLSVSAIGLGLSLVDDIKRKHAVKQVDRLLSNTKLSPPVFAASWVPHLVGSREEIVVALDWTDFAADDHQTVCLYLVTERGRASPLVWLTAYKTGLIGWQRAFEEDVLLRLRQVLPPTVKKVTILADRAFGDVELYRFLRKELGFEFVIRFRANVVVRAEGSEGRAGAWAAATGRAKLLRNVEVTQARYEVPSVAVVKKPGMKETWCLASSLDLKATEIIKLYARRFTIEETFRDTKDPRFGFGLAATHVKDAERRDRLLLTAALAFELLCALGEAGEELGHDRMLKTNTSKKRQHSFFAQGWMYWQYLTVWTEERVGPLLERFLAKLHASEALCGLVRAE